MKASGGGRRGALKKGFDLVDAASWAVKFVAKETVGGAGRVA